MGLEKCPPGWCICSKYYHSQESGIQESRGCESVLLLTFSPHDPMAKILLPFPTTIGSAGLCILAPKEGMLLPIRHNSDSPELEVKTATQPL